MSAAFTGGLDHGRYKDHVSSKQYPLRWMLCPDILHPFYNIDNTIAANIGIF